MKIGDKLTKVNDSFSVNMYDNGYMLEISGRTDDDEWGSAKIMCKNIDELIALVKEAGELPRD